MLHMVIWKTSLRLLVFCVVSPFNPFCPLNHQALSQWHIFILCFSFLECSSSSSDSSHSSELKCYFLRDKVPKPQSKNLPQLLSVSLTHWLHWQHLSQSILSFVYLLGRWYSVILPAMNLCSATYELSDSGQVTNFSFPLLFPQSLYLDNNGV